MNYERPEEISEPSRSPVVVRDDAVRDLEAKSAPKVSQAADKEKSSGKKVSEAKVKMQTRLPALEDDPDVGIQKDQVVVRDGKPDLSFIGTLLASAASASAPQGTWREYRVYET